MSIIQPLYADRAVPFTRNPPTMHEGKGRDILQSLHAIQTHSGELKRLVEESSLRQRNKYRQKWSQEELGIATARFCGYLKSDARKVLLTPVLL